MEGSREGAPRIAGIGVMIGPEKDGIRACSHICRGERARLDARVRPGALSAGQAWKGQPGGMSL